MPALVRPLPRAPALDDHGDDYEDSLAFGDFCLRCGGPSQGSYCSKECRRSDAEPSQHSPDYSPSLSALPALVSSAKSVCSTPPSSATNSPSPRGIAGDLGEEPPHLDLPAPAHKFPYGGHSLPLGVRFPTAASNWALSYNSEATPFGDRRAEPPTNQLVYHRKSNKPSQTIPAPLYYRERAAIVHSSPALTPSSPSSRRATPPVFWSPQLASTKSIPDFDLEEEQPLAPSRALPPRTTNCGRPGCVGVPARPNLADVQHAKDTMNRRKSWTSAPAGALRPLTSPAEAGDVLMSPRIRALRGLEGGLGAIEPLDDLEMGREAEGEVDDGRHSAFACYLFSQLADKAAPVQDDMEEMLRGRSAAPAAPAEEKRSLSVDAAALARRNSNSGPALGRPTRFLFSRGSPAPTPAAETEHTSFDPDATIRGSSAASSRPQLTAGHFISATTASGISGISPFPSPPPSPPTAGRGRSTTRFADSYVEPDGFEPRGRSNMRAVGAAASERSLSRGRQSSRAASDREGRESRSRRRESTGRESRGRESRGRGRGGRMDEGDLEEAVVEEEEEDEERGRARGRSRSLLRRGMGREVAISGAAYGHDDLW